MRNGDNVASIVFTAPWRRENQVVLLVNGSIEPVSDHEVEVFVDVCSGKHRVQTTAGGNEPLVELRCLVLKS